MGNITNIDEIIADARAEEEAKKATAKEELTNALTRSFTDAFNSKMDAKKREVVVDLDEYVQLKHLEYDYARIIDAISRSFGLNYRHEELRINDEESILIAFKALYPAEFEKLEEEKVSEWLAEHPNGEDEDE